MTSQGLYSNEAVFTEVDKDNKGKTALWILPEMQEKTLCKVWKIRVCPANKGECRSIWHEDEANGEWCEENVTQYTVIL